MDATALAISGGWAVGTRTYATLLVLGVLGRTGVADVPEFIQRAEALIVVGVLAVVELVADKIQFVDSLWDTVHIAVRPIVAGVIGWSAAADAGPLGQTVIVLVAGGTALLAHGGKAGTRLAVNAFPGAVPNATISVAEDALVIGVLLLASQHAWIGAGVAIALLVVSLALGAALTPRVRQGWQVLRHRYFAARDAPP
ncbi:MAG: DUF4126 domain-containing protein [Actinomycetota bacterium]